MQAGFNSVVRPILTLNGNIPRANRWKWFPASNGNSSVAVVRLVDAGNVMFSGVPLGTGQNVTVANIKVDVIAKGVAVGCNGYPPPPLRYLLLCFAADDDCCLLAAVRLPRTRSARTCGSCGGRHRCRSTRPTRPTSRPTRASCFPWPRPMPPPRACAWFGTRCSRCSRVRMCPCPALR